MLAIGEVLDVAGPRTGRLRNARRRTGALRLDATRTLEELFAVLALDFVHVYEPFAPSLASAALRHSRSLNVGRLPLALRAAALDAGRRAGSWSPSLAAWTRARRASPTTAGMLGAHYPGTTG